MAAKNSIQVGIKARPLLTREKFLPCCWRVVENSIQLTEGQSEPYYFDYIFDQDATNQIIFDKMAKQIVHSSIQGFNGTIFAYGQTSSGKTYTMMGEGENPGVMVLAAKEIFKEIEKSSDRQFLLRVGYIEIYNEKIYDLFNKKNQDLKIHETATGMVSVNCEENIITSEEDLLHHLCMGNKERTVGETNMNERSSRSHAIFRIIIESRKIDRTDDDAVIQSVLNLVDLAGSERADQTGARGARLKEGGHINKSLLFLSNVIKRLSENEEDKYISYRDSKLTRILQASLGGNALTSIICTIKPTVVEETQSTLSFAMRAKSIKNKPKVNEIVSDATMMKRLESEIKELKTRLAEERRKNESQIKVGQLEQRIKSEVLKIISCNSLHNIRNQREKRRRTWCSTTSLPDPPQLESSMHSVLPASTVTTLSAIPTRLPKPHISFSRNAVSFDSCPPPSMLNVDYNGNAGATVSPISEEKEEFIPGELCHFEKSPTDLNSKQWNECKTPDCNYSGSTASTPVGPASLGLKLKIVERDLQELQEFTNLENKIDVKHDIYDALKQELQLVSNRNVVLENERLENIQMKDEFLLTKQSLTDCEKHCNDLQIEVSKLENSNKTASAKIEKYEAQLAQLRETTTKLEMENRDAVSLEFEFQRHKNKSKQRETELLEVLTEKDKEISKLEKSLKSLREEKLHNSREELMLSPHAGVEKEAKAVCAKCEEMEFLLGRNKKITIEFEKLTQEYEKLKQDYAEATADAALARAQLVELEQNKNVDVAECEKLLAEIITMREKLKTVQREYEQLQWDHNAKTDACEELNVRIEATREEVRLLQAKYDKLDEAWRAQKEIVSEIQADYDAIQLKYQVLQTEYEKLEHSSLEDCARLQRENECLHVEINELKTRVEEAQKQLLAEPTSKEDIAATAEIEQQNRKLSQDLQQVQQQFEEMQREYDDLSNQLMDNLQEGEALRDRCKQLELRNSELEQLRDAHASSAQTASAHYESAKRALEEEINNLKYQLEEKCNNEKSLHGETIRSESMRSSGIGLDREQLTQVSSDTLVKFGELIDALQQIELEHMSGKRCVFVAKRRQECTEHVPACKLLLRNMQEITTKEENVDLSLSCDNKLLMQGTLTRHSFHIIELGTSEVENSATLKALNGEAAHNVAEDTPMHAESMAELQQQIAALLSTNQQLCAERQSLVESTEHTINEMRQQIESLSEALFEKSTFMEDYQKQIECLERERAEMTIVYDELQGKLNFSADESNAKDGNATRCLNGSTNVTDEADSEQVRCLQAMQATLSANISKLEGELEAQVEMLQSKTKEIETLQSKCKELEKTGIAAEAKILALQTEHAQQLSDVESALAAAKLQLQHKEQEYKRECDRLQLELYEKLELNENESRENLRKYNGEWEAGKLAYESTIESQQEQLKALAEQVERKQQESLAMQETVEILENQAKTAALELKEQTAKETALLQKVDALTALQAKFPQLQENVLKLQQENAQLKEQCKAKSEEFQQSVGKMSSEWEAAKLAYESTIESQQKQLKALTEQVERKQQESLAMQETVKILENQAKTAALELKEQTAKETALLQKVDALTALQAKFPQLQENVLKLQQENAQLKEQCKAKSEELQQSAGKMSNIELELAATLEQKLSDDAVIATLRTTLESYETLQAEKAALQRSIEHVKMEHTNALKALQAERDNLSLALEKEQQEKRDVVEREETLRLKLDTALQQLHDLQGKALAYEKLLDEFEDLEKLHASVNREKVALNAQVQTLEATLGIVQKQGTERVQQLEQELHAARAKSVAAAEQQAAMQSQLTSISAELKAERVALQRECSDLQSALTELQLKRDSLQAANTQLQQRSSSLEQQLLSATQKAAACESLSAELKRLKRRHGELQATNSELLAKESAFKLAKQELEGTIAELQAVNKNLRSSLLAKESAFKLAKQELEGTIACLLLEKQSFEGQQHANVMLIKKYECELATLQKQSSDVGVSNSLHSPNSSCSPGSRRSAERLVAENMPLKSINVNVEDKLSAKQQKSLQIESAERKNRRLSTHDERRRQSVWQVARDVACMTDPADTNCMCVELDRKLKECEKNLFIRESQVTALNLELKSNPLKAENAALIKRLQDEQEKNRSEAKRYKHMIMEQKIKMAKATDTAVATAVATATAKLQPAQVVEVPPKVVGNAETQTESDLEAVLHKLEGKYNDLKNICRRRYSMIKDLEEKVAQKQNGGENEAIKALETQCESLKQELKMLKKKYEDAKAVLYIRREEIQRLRAQLGQVVSAE